VDRTILGWHIDEDGDWVAELSCLHGQHVRHRPPFFNRPWTLTTKGRESRIGSILDCPLCDRAEPPEGLVVTRTAGPFDQASLPAALLKEHVVAPMTWGELRILAGSIRFEMETDPVYERLVASGESQAIPPEVKHRLVLDGSVTLVVDFRVRPA
jgi:tellurite methyltransferase